MGRGQGIRSELEYLAEIATMAVKDGYKLIVLSDRKANEENVPIGSLLAVGAIHQALVKQGMRSKVGLVVECGDARERRSNTQSRHKSLLAASKELTTEKIIKNYQKSCIKGLAKVMSKIGISTVQGYKSAMIFEAVGIGEEVMEMCFTDGTSRVSGVGFETLATTCFVSTVKHTACTNGNLGASLRNTSIHQKRSLTLIKSVRRANIQKDGIASVKKYSDLTNELHGIALCEVKWMWS
eukprot:g14240.t1